MSDDDLDGLGLDELKQQRDQLLQQKAAVRARDLASADPNTLSLDELKQARGYLNQQKYAPQLDTARQQAAEKWGSQEGAGHFVGRKVTTGIASLENAAADVFGAGLGSSYKRLNEGNPTEDDFRNIATYDHFTQQDQKLGRGGRLAGALLSVAGDVPLFMAGGAVAGAAAPGLGLAGEATSLAGKAGQFAGRAVVQTAATPHMYLPQIIQKNIAEGKDPYDFSNVPQSFGLAATQMLVMSAAGKLLEPLNTKLGLSQEGWQVPLAKSVTAPTPGVAAALGRTALQGAAGAPVSAVTDVVTSAIGLDTGYGTVGDLWHGKYGEAGEKALHQALTFAAFHGSNELMGEYASSLRELKKQGYSFNEASKVAGEALKSGQSAGVQQADEVARAAGPPAAQGPTPPDGEAQQAAPTTVPGQAPVQEPGATPADLRGVRDQENGIVKTMAGDLPAEVAKRLYPEAQKAPPAETDKVNPPGEVGPTPHDESGAPKEGNATVVPGSQERHPLTGLTDAEQAFADRIMYSQEGIADRQDLIKRVKESLTKAEMVEVARGYYDPTGNVLKYGAPASVVHGLSKYDKATAAERLVMSVPNKTLIELARRVGVLPEEGNAAPAPGSDEKAPVAPPEPTTVPPVESRTTEPGAAETTPGAAKTPLDLEAVRQLKPGETPVEYAKRLMAESGQPVNEADLRGIGVKQRDATNILRGLVDEGYAKRDGSFYVPNEPVTPEVQNVQSQARKAGLSTPAVEESTARGTQSGTASGLEESRARSPQEAYASLSAADRDAFDSLAAKLNSGGELTGREQQRLDALTEKMYPQVVEGRAQEGSLRSRAMAEGVSHETIRKRDQAAGVDTSGKLSPQEQRDAAERKAELQYKATTTLADLLKDDAGFINVGQTVQKAAEGLAEVHDNIRELSGQSFPKSHDFDREIGEAMTRLPAAKTYGLTAGPVFAEKVMPGATEADRKFVGSLATELHLQHTKSFRLQEADQHKAARDQARIDAKNATKPLEKYRFEQKAKRENKAFKEARDEANAVKSFIGTPDFPAQTPAEFQQMVGSKKFIDFLDAYQKHVAPLVDDFYRRATGINGPLPPSAQIPGFPMNLMRADPNAPTKTTIGQPGGNLRNVRQAKLQFSKRRSGASDAYEADMHAIIANTFEQSAKAAAHAELNNLLVNKGVAQFAMPGKVKDINGVPTASFPFAKGEKSINVIQPLAGDYERALNVDKARTYLTTAPLNAVAKVALASTVEAASHGHSLLGMMFTPKGVSGVTKSVYDRIYNNQQWKSQLVELARIGAAKSPGMESAGFSVLKPMGQALHSLDSLVRVGASNAFDALAKKGGIQVTEQNRRDFVNQAGNYNKATQNQMVRLLRETGIGPFATAASNTTMRSLKLLVGEHGLKTTGWKSDLALRAQVLGKVGALLGTAAAANYLAWGSVFGDDETPLGSIKVGEYEGKSVSVDLPGVALIRRGLRTAGLLALAEGIRHDEEPSLIAAKAFKGMAQSALHPAEGPGVSAVHTLLTGENTLGTQIADRPEKGEGDLYERAKAAALTMNPLVGALTGADETPKARENQTWTERLAKLLGPFGPKFRESK